AEDRAFAQYVFGSRERPAEIERKCAVREIRSNQRGADKRGLQPRKDCLYLQEVLEEVAVDLQEPGLLPHQSQHGRVLIQIKHADCEQRQKEASDITHEQEARAEDGFERVALQN